MKLQSKGSVKDLYHLDNRTCFQFSDRYSLFDWGEMPDQIENKGKSLASMAVSFFELLKKENIPNHFVSAINSNFERVSSLDPTVTGFEFSPARVVKPTLLANSTYQYPKLAGDFFIPLEVIFRMGVPEGSSKAKEFPVGTIFETPMVEFTTKLEKQDRPLTETEAFEISSLSVGQFEELKRMTIAIAQILKDFFAELKIELWDGKFEFASVEQELVLVDAIGPDELRLNFQGIPISKELLRKWYRQTDWYKEVINKKKQHATDWKNLVQLKPENLNSAKLQCISQMYSSLSGQIFNQVFNGADQSKKVLSLEDWSKGSAGVL